MHFVDKEILSYIKKGQHPPLHLYFTYEYRIVYKEHNKYSMSIFINYCLN
jgi:hypothetical protein